MNRTEDGGRWALAFHGVVDEARLTPLARQYYENVCELLRRIGRRVTHYRIANAGKGGSRVSKATSDRIEQAIQANLEVPFSLTLDSNNRGPEYDPPVRCWFSVTKRYEVFLSVACDNALLSFGSSEFEDLLGRFASCFSWFGGYAYMGTIQERPEFYALAMDTGNLPKDATERLNRWYTAPLEQRIVKPRAIHPYLFLSDAQLNIKVEESKPLTTMLESRATGGSVRGGKLYRFSPKDVTALRQQLEGTGILIEA
jgi:hypothetical protein